MLRPLAMQAALEGLLETRSSPADVALVVLSDSGTMYAQAHLLNDKPKHSNGGPAARTQTSHIDELQRAHQPGLTALMPLHTGEPTTREPVASSTASPMLISLTPDERARVLAGSACQAWTEEVARVRRLRTSVSGRFAGMAASTAPSVTSGGSSGTGLRGASGFPPPLTKLHPTGEDSVEAGSASPALPRSEEDEEEQVETTAVPIAILGAPLPTSTAEGTAPDMAPLLLESELGAMLVLPLLPQGARLTNGTNGTGSVNDTNASVVRPLTSHAALLLVLSAAVPATSPDVGSTTHVDALRRGNSSLTQNEWNALHDSAQSFATFVAPALRKAFGRTGELLSDDHPGGGAGAIGGAANGPGGNGGGATTIFSDDRESVASVEASQMLGHVGAAQSASQISVP